MDMIAWCKPHGNLWEYGKFVGDASIANLIHSLCDLLTFANINNRAHLQVLQLPSERQKTKRHSASRGLRPLTSYRGLCTMDLRARGAPPADPRYMCALRARHGIRTLCSSKLILKKPWEYARPVRHWPHRRAGVTRLFALGRLSSLLNVPTTVVAEMN